MSYFSKEISDVFNELGCDKNGLESKNIEKLHEKYGYNSLEEKEKATARFKEALGYLEEAAKVSPDNANVKKMIPQVQDAMK